MVSPDESTLLARAQLSLDAGAIGQSILDGDLVEAEFRARFLCAHALDLDMADVADAALHVLALLPHGQQLPQAGIGAALVHLADTLSVDVPASPPNAPAPSRPGSA